MDEAYLRAPTAKRKKVSFVRETTTTTTRKRRTAERSTQRGDVVEAGLTENRGGVVGDNCVREKISFRPSLDTVTTRTSSQDNADALR
jgi:hypothetical protein